MRAIVLVVFGLGCAAEPTPRTASDRRPAPTRDKLVLPVDPDIRAMVEAVDAARMRADVEKLVSFGTRHSLSDAASETRGVGAAARWVRARFAEAGVDATLEDYVAPAGKRVPREWPMQNVVAVLPGTDTGTDARTVIVSGHLDSRATDVTDAAIDAPGANDDASGVAVSLEACRVMAPHRFRASVVFVAVTGEEQGLLGSTALAKRMKDAGTRVEAMITNDIVGASVSTSGDADKSRVRVFSPGLPFDPAARDALLAVGGENDGPARQLARAIAEAAATYVRGFGTMLVFRLDRYLRGGDHRPFHEAGFPAARITELLEDFRRQHEDVREGYGDTIDHVDFEYAANVARVNVAALASLARAPAAPTQARLDVRGLANDSRILWVPSSDASITYEVVVRPTDAPDWTERIPAGRSGEIVVPRSKDHFHLGLRAVDADGHRSRAVFPLPLREGDPWPPS